MNIPALVHFHAADAWPLVLAFVASRASHMAWPYFARFLSRV